MTAAALATFAASIGLRVIAAYFARALALALGARGSAAVLVAVLHALVGARSGVLAATALPLLLLGIERARGRGGAAVALATTLMLLSHDRDAAMVDLTLAGGWALLRLTLSTGGWNARLARNLLIGGGAGAACGLALSWIFAIAPRSGLAAPGSGLAAGCAVAVSALAVVGARRGRAIRWFLLAWIALVAGRALGVPLAAFLLDIVAPMTDAAFVAAAMPSLVLASLVLAALAWSDARRRDVPVAVLVLAEMGCLIMAGAPSGPAPEPMEYVSDGAGPHARALALGPGESLTGVLPGAIVATGMARRVGVEIGTYLGRSDGALAISLCADARCETGTAPLAGAADNAVVFATLPDALPVRAGQALRWRAAHVSGTMPVAVWLGAAVGRRDLEGPAGPLTDMSAHVVLGYASGRRAFAPDAP